MWRGAEDALSDAFAAALVDWPDRGVPNSPEAWLLAVARRQVVRRRRRRRVGDTAATISALLAEELEAMAGADAEIPDERWRLMFACAHPAIEPAIRAPLILQTVLGFDAAAIGSAFLVSPAAMGQRLVRAKNKIRAAGIPSACPNAPSGASGSRPCWRRSTRFSPKAGPIPRRRGARRDLAEEAIWLGRLSPRCCPTSPRRLACWR